MTRQLFRTAIITSDFRQNPDVDPLTPESVAGWLVIGSTFECDEREWQIFDNFEHAQERCWELMDGYCETRTKWNVYPLYAGEPVQVTKVSKVEE